MVCLTKLEIMLLVDGLVFEVSNDAFDGLEGVKSGMEVFNYQAIGSSLHSP